MQSFLIYITGPASLKVVQKARNRGSECCRLCFYSGLHQGGFFWGRKWRPFFSVFRRECVWVWWCLPAATKICWWAVLCVSCKRKALTQLPCLFSSRYSIYCCMTWTWLSAEAEKRNSFRGETQTHVVLKEKKKKKRHLKSGVRQNNLSFHTHWAGATRVSLCANTNTKTPLPQAPCMGCWSKTPEQCEFAPLQSS